MKGIIPNENQLVESSGPMAKSDLTLANAAEDPECLRGPRPQASDSHHPGPLVSVRQCRTSEGGWTADSPCSWEGSLHLARQGLLSKLLREGCGHPRKKGRPDPAP